MSGKVRSTPRAPHTACSVARHPHLYSPDALVSALYRWGDLLTFLSNPASVQGVRRNCNCFFLVLLVIKRDRDREKMTSLDTCPGTCRTTTGTSKRCRRSEMLVIRKRRKIKKESVSCRNCKHYKNGICSVLSKIFNVRSHHVGSTANAHKCKYYTNKYGK